MSMKTILIFLAIVLLLVGAAQAYFLVGSSKIEEQTYQVLKTENDLEFRFYPSATMATVQIQAEDYRTVGRQGFRSLASYIFGGNNDSTKIAMTAPVHMQKTDSGSAMSFVMPAKFELQDLPQPSSSAVQLTESAPEHVAAITFGGYANDSTIARKTRELEQKLNEMGVKHLDNFRFLGYNAPYQAVGRRNDVIVGVVWER